MKNLFTLIFECLALGYPSPSYQWKHSNKVISNTSTIEIDDFHDTFIAKYVCQVESFAGKFQEEVQTSDSCEFFTIALQKGLFECIISRHLLI